MADDVRCTRVSRGARGDDWLAVTGVLTLEASVVLRREMLKLAADAGSAVVVDVSRLTVPQGFLLSVFASVQTQIATWPGIPLLLAAGTVEQRGMLADSTVGRFVPVYRTVEEAFALLPLAPMRRQGKTTLPGTAVAPSIARAWVRDTCEEWGVPTAAIAANMIANELVTNAVMHTASEPVLRIELRSALFTIAVSDEAARPPVLREQTADGTRTSGLHLVAQVAKAWGHLPRVTGKVVWASLRPSEINGFDPRRSAPA
jgi:anti-sigma regulatory factor (Ser/Thr protein kinase)